MNTRAHVERIPKYNVMIVEVVHGVAAHGQLAGHRGWVQVPLKAEVLGIFNITTSVFYQFYS